MAETLGVYDAKARFSELIDRAERGEETVVTRHGRPVARVAPLSGLRRSPEETAAFMARHRELRARILAEHGPTTRAEIKAWKEEGRR